MNKAYFFGYGSLVNLSTHIYEDAHAATLLGFQRVWCDVPAYDVALLSIKAAADQRIQGVIAQVPDDNWSALDERERGYDRYSVRENVVCLDGFLPAHCSVYQVPRQREQRAPAPILLSYLDVVIQGFLDIHGPSGAEHFFATTAGWERGILDDRATPRYPRHRKLSTDQTCIVDGLIGTHAHIRERI